METAAALLENSQNAQKESTSASRPDAVVYIDSRELELAGRAMERILRAIVGALHAPIDLRRRGR